MQLCSSRLKGEWETNPERHVGLMMGWPWDAQVRTWQAMGTGHRRVLGRFEEREEHEARGNITRRTKEVVTLVPLSPPGPLSGPDFLGDAFSTIGMGITF